MSSNLKDISNTIADVIASSIDTAVDAAVESHLESTKAYRTIESAIESVVENYDFSSVIDEDLINNNIDISSMVESEIESQVESKVEGILADKAEEWETNLKQAKDMAFALEGVLAEAWNKLEDRIVALELALESTKRQKAGGWMARVQNWFKAKFRANTAKLPIA